MLRNMEIVYTIYKTGSFSKAAEELFMTQSSISTVVSKIERELNCRLFDRHKQPIQLTQAGEQYLQYYQKFRSIYHEMMASLQDLSNMQQGTLYIGGTHYLLSYILVDALREFSQRYPKIHLSIIESSSSQFNDMLLNHTIDLCLKCDACSKDTQTLSHAFFDQLFLAVPVEMVSQYRLPENALSYDNIIENDFHFFDHNLPPEYLASLPFIQLLPGNNLYERSNEIFRQFSITPNIVLGLQQFVTAYSFAAHGLGCTLTSSLIIKNSRNPHLVYYSLPSPLMIRDFHFVVRRDAYIPNVVTAFCKIFQEIHGKEDQSRRQQIAEYSAL